MNIVKKDLGKSQIELLVEISIEEMQPYIEKAVVNVSMEVKVDGFRPGKVPAEVLKAKIGEMSILEEAARLAIKKTIDDVVKEHAGGEPVGQPQVSITKLAPGNAMEYKLTLALLPEVEIEIYKDLKIKIKKEKIEDKEVDKMLDDLREMKVQETLSDQAATTKDKVIVDLDMFIEKVPLEGGQAKDVAIIINRDQFVPGLGKKLIGIKKGETREFSLPYPADFHQANLAGKLVDFKVTAKDVFTRILPEANDEFAIAFGLKTAEELKKNVRTTIQSQKDRQSDELSETEMLDQLIAKARFGDIPELLVNHEVDMMINELEHNIEHQGGRFDDYLASIKKTKDQLVLDILPDAVKRVKASLLIKKVAQKEEIKVEEREIDRHIADMIRHYKDNKDIEERLELPEYRSYAHSLILNRKTLGKLKEWNLLNEENI